MKKLLLRKDLVAFTIGLLIGGLSIYQITLNTAHDRYDTAYHVHADFKIYINGDKLDLSDEKYMTEAGHQLSEHVHLHDGNDTVEHIHAENVSFADMKQTLLYYAKEMYGADVKIRLRPSYFPFTEPSAEMDVYWEQAKRLKNK